MSDRDDGGTPADCCRCAWLAACAAARCSAPGSVRPQGLWDSVWEGDCCAWDPLGARGDRTGTRHWNRSSLCGWEGNEQTGNTAAGVNGGKTGRKEPVKEGQEEGEVMLQSPCEQRLTGRSVSRHALRNCQTSALELQPQTSQGQLSHHQACRD